MERVKVEGSRPGLWSMKLGSKFKANVTVPITVASVKGRTGRLWVEPLDPHFEVQEVLQDNQPPG